MCRTVFFVAFSALLAGFVFTLPSRADDPAPKDGGAAREVPVDLQNATCPVKGKPVAKGITAEVNGTIVHFCCSGCAAKYEADPAPYQEALRKDPAVAKRLDAIAAGAAHAEGMEPGATHSRDELHDAMRQLWQDHVVWTRQFIVSTLAGLPDADAATKRLLDNQTDIGNGIKPFYGEEAGKQLTELLRDHILVAAEIVKASKAGDSAKAEDAGKRWAANADEIAAFLAKANPAAWPLEAGKSMMRDHLELTSAMLKARLEKDWVKDVAIYEKVRRQALEMADMLTEGIRKQFPKKD